MCWHLTRTLALFKPMHVSLMVTTSLSRAPKITQLDVYRQHGQGSGSTS